MNLFLV